MRQILRFLAFAFLLWFCYALLLLLIAQTEPKGDHGSVVRDLTDNIQVVDTFSRDRIIPRKGIVIYLPSRKGGNSHAVPNSPQ